MKESPRQQQEIRNRAESRKRARERLATRMEQRNYNKLLQALVKSTIIHQHGQTWKNYKGIKRAKWEAPKSKSGNEKTRRAQPEPDGALTEGVDREPPGGAI